MNSQTQREGREDSAALGDRRDSEGGDLKPASYYRCSCIEIVIELLAFVLIILFPALTGRYDLYPIVAPIAFILLLVIWVCNKSDGLEP